MVSTLVNQVTTGTPMIVNRLVLVQRLLPVALVDRVLSAVAVQVLLAWDRLKRIFVWRDEIIALSVRDGQRVLRTVSV